MGGQLRWAIGRRKSRFVSDAPCDQLQQLHEVTSQNKAYKVPSGKKGLGEVARRLCAILRMALMVIVRVAILGLFAVPFLFLTRQTSGMACNHGHRQGQWCRQPAEHLLCQPHPCIQPIGGGGHGQQFVPSEYKWYSICARRMYHCAGNKIFFSFFLFGLFCGR